MISLPIWLIRLFVKNGFTWFLNVDILPLMVLEETYNFLKDVDFYRMHIFKYSQRKGTPAEKMPNQIDGNIKEQRSNRLIDLSNENENKHNNSYIGKTVNVLFEEFENGFFKGHTKNYIMVNVPGTKEQENLFVNNILSVLVEENREDTRELVGNIIK